MADDEATSASPNSRIKVKGKQPDVFVKYDTLAVVLSILNKRIKTWLELANREREESGKPPLEALLLHLNKKEVYRNMASKINGNRPAESTQSKLSHITLLGFSIRFIWSKTHAIFKGEIVPVINWNDRVYVDIKELIADALMCFGISDNLRDETWTQVKKTPIRNYDDWDIYPLIENIDEVVDPNPQVATMDKQHLSYFFPYICRLLKCNLSKAEMQLFPEPLITG